MTPALPISATKEEKGGEIFFFIFIFNFLPHFHFLPLRKRKEDQARLDQELAEDPESFNLSGSDLRWTHDYGTGEFQVGHRDSAGPPKGRTRFPVKSAKLLPDGKSVFVEVENLQPVHMMQIDLDLETDDGEEIVTRIWNTIHVTQ